MRLTLTDTVDVGSDQLAARHGSRLQTLAVVVMHGGGLCGALKQDRHASDTQSLISHRHHAAYAIITAHIVHFTSFHRIIRSIICIAISITPYHITESHQIAHA